MAWQDADATSSDGAKPGDQALTCDQLRTEMSALEGELLGMTKKVETIAKQQTTGMLAKQSAGNLAKQALSGLASTLIPGAGGLISMGMGAATSPDMGNGERAAAMMSALQPVIEQQTVMAQRMQHVGTLHADKCAASASSAPHTASQ
ncbi:hypothetical protein [Sphingopyxis sp.]|uniref:hypothetical protein n=1 Tax=Sphingopyxis sp. TaxID=1908224 RepID=UPI001D406FF9|nr:hypothetical protein [Sphingopyxis sp.]MBW8294300.1 hypothetical protein [Sphingopyxis sp.]